MLGVVLVGVAIWGGALIWFRVFEDSGTAFHFALCSCTTVDY